MFEPVLTSDLPAIVPLHNGLMICFNKHLYLAAGRKVFWQVTMLSLYNLIKVPINFAHFALKRNAEPVKLVNKLPL